jgi:predicted dehydrogenase
MAAESREGAESPGRNHCVKALVVGYGSIGLRHARVLVELGCRVAVVSRRPVAFAPRCAELIDAILEFQPDYVVIANRTSEHRETLGSLASLGFQGRVLVEKPLFDQPLPLPDHRFALAAVAYNLRFHTLLLRLKEFLGTQSGVVAAHFYVGQYLPQWRPGADYRESYSAHRQQGGGVLRDLSHELDCTLWLFGAWRRLTSLGGRLSTLEIDSEDVFSLLMETERCPIVSINLNYLDRIPRREILVHTHEHTVRIDLIAGAYELDGISETVVVQADATYRAEHIAMLAGDRSNLCSLADAARTLETIEAAERAAMTHAWVER